MIEYGQGWGLVDERQTLVASALTLPQASGAFGWISMVLVTKSWQRLGLATGLLVKCVKSLTDKNLTPGLDATEFGRPVYLPLGFQDVYTLTRMERGASDENSGTISTTVRTLTAHDLASAETLDRNAFGADRSALLAHLRARAPEMAWLCRDGGGFCLGRDGLNARQVGPIVAGDDKAAIDLVGEALRHVAGPIFIDVADHHPAFLKWLTSAGFKPQRKYVRMLYRRSNPVDDPQHIFAIAGPELG